MIIEKKALNQMLYSRKLIYTNSAREAWGNIINIYKEENAGGKILLPSYVGWSSNEGSGIFDPVSKSGLEYEFYELDECLNINIEDLKKKTKETDNPMILIVHYFGFIDTNYDQITDWLIDNKVFFVEDSAHAWLTDLLGGRCGRKGNYSFYSLHKLLPISKGGFLVKNTPEDDIEKQDVSIFNLNYDLLSIYIKRRDNYKYLYGLLKEVEEIEILHHSLEDGICPQTFPIIIKNYNRDKLYHEMNQRSYGVVSLYHTMINPLKASSSGASFVLSKKIMNLPIHQDVKKEQLDSMVSQLKRILHV
ncbi:DegT/DnrJ/EryC1/StrS family aminotransferase [Pseudotenacibaculum sp. MALMAid0570]|uniref:DegT/DnrJ/EryC1/StrS family aminotransferase n=1 Tax=Pseudotenacibaculum sp. MALMAid0570 TaxID=3143938 RepID=UPI0032DF9C2C